jgi:DNA invertase Pin-like site-specific DNA recombinase
MTGLPAVIYAAKSTEDTRGSIATQLADCHALAEREGWRVVEEFTDEGFSAYRGNRGPGLARAKAALAKHAPCVLVVQHTDRLARGAGDEPGAADHLMELFFWLGRQNIDLWAVQSGKVDRIRALLEGERTRRTRSAKAPRRETA